MQGRDERRATNETYFRAVNERVEEQAKDIAGEHVPFNILCECASLTCAQRLVMTPAEYELHHENPRQFIVALGHVDDEIEDSVTRNDTLRSGSQARSGWRHRRGERGRLSW